MITVSIREQCERRGITTAYQLQKKADVSPSVANAWFNNRLDRVEVRTLDKLCTLLECNPSDLFRFEPSVVETNGGRGRKEG